MKVSVIVTYHDEERYLQDCLESLEEQTFRDFQVILVGDNCKAMIPSVSFEIEEYEMTESSGVAAARNFGLSHAIGEYVYFLDCDDYIEKDALEHLVEKEADLIYGATRETWYKRQLFYENGQELDEQNGIDTNPDLPSNPWEALISLTKQLDTVSVHSILFRKEYLDGMNLTFDESLQFLCDYPFLVKALAGTKSIVDCQGSLYIKRNHNDPINLPSLSQMKDNHSRVLESIRVFNQMAAKQGVDAKRLGQQFVHYVATWLAQYFRQSSEEERNLVFDALQPVGIHFDHKVLADECHYHKVLIRLIQKGKREVFFRKIKQKAHLQTLKKIVFSRAALKRFLYQKVFIKQKMFHNTVLLESFFGKSYSDSPKYIFEYLNEKYPGKYNYVWIMNQKHQLPYKAKQIKRFSFRYFYYLARSKYIVFNSRQPLYFIKRKGNVFLETWHGTPLKKLVFDMEEVTSASPLYKEQFYTQTRSWDYLVAPNEFTAEIFGHAFMYDGPLLRTGYPRNDILYHPDKKEIAKQIKNKLGIPHNKKVMLYAPTWRDDEYYGSGQYKFSLKLRLDQMQERLGKDWVVILRTHYFIADSLDVTQYGDFVYNLSKYDDIAELYLISDILITDYSSVFFDYANLRRPILFYTYDLEKYRDVLRGFYIDMENDLPGPLLSSTEEVIEAIENIDGLTNEYKEKYQKFCDKFCDFENGHATEKIVDMVFR